MKTEEIFIGEKIIIYLIGQNSQDNFNIIDKCSSTDLWFHAESCSSCHVVVILPPNLTNKELKQIIKRGGILCKENTTKLKSLKNVEITYTQIKNVKKTNIIGEVSITNSKIIIIK